MKFKKLISEKLKNQFLYIILPILVIGFTFIVGFTSIVWDSTTVSSSGQWISISSRMINGFFAALLTSMALIITLTANLYTPRLARLFVGHPMTIAGMGLILLSNLFLMLTQVLPHDHAMYDPINVIAYIINIIAIGGIIPYLYYVSQFIKPSFFLPQLQQQVIDGIDKMRLKNQPLEFKKDIFGVFDVIANIAYTAAKRDDKQLMALVFNSIHDIFNHIISNYPEEKSNWRQADCLFQAGISQEGRFYLEKEKSWPESYVIGKTVKILGHLEKTHNEILPIVCEKLLETLDEAIYQERRDIVEMHLMVFNAIFRNALDQRDLERFQSISYYYRLAIELLEEDDQMMKFATQSFIHYGEVASRKKMEVAMETIYFDLGRIILYFAYEDESIALNYVEHFIMPNLKVEQLLNGPLSEVHYKTMVKTFWESKSRGFEKLSKFIYTHFIKDDTKHDEALKNLLNYPRVLHWEYNDRLLSFAHLSDNAQKIALEYMSKQSA